MTCQSKDHQTNHNPDLLGNKPSPKIMSSSYLLDSPLGRRQAQESVWLKRFHRVTFGIDQGLLSFVDIPTGGDVDAEYRNRGLGDVVEDVMVRRSNGGMEGEAYSHRRGMRCKLEIQVLIENQARRTEDGVHDDVDLFVGLQKILFGLDDGNIHVLALLRQPSVNFLFGLLRRFDYLSDCLLPTGLLGNVRLLTAT
jgi:hypothetical protein